MAIKKKPEEDQYVLAFDPGGTTGMAIVRFNSKEVALSVLAQIEDAHMGFYDNLYGTPGGIGTPIHLVSEKWVSTGVKGADHTPLVIEGIQYAFWPDQVQYQVPAMKHDITDDVLKEIGVWTPGKPHQMDALRHALVWLRNQMHAPTLKLLGEEGQTMQKDGEAAEGMESGAGEQGGEGQDQPGEGQVPGLEQALQDLLDTDGGADSDKPVSPQEALARAMSFLHTVDQDEADALSALIAETEKVYKKERDLDGAFSGYQADASAERRTLIDEDF